MLRPFLKSIVTVEFIQNGSYCEISLFTSLNNFHFVNYDRITNKESNKKYIGYNLTFIYIV